MRKQLTFLWKQILFASAILTVVASFENSWAQETGESMTLIAVQQKTHKQISFAKSGTVYYKNKTIASNIFMKGKIAAITESTISFYDSYKLVVTAASGATQVFVPGMDVRMILKNGDKVARMKVLQIGAEEIDGIQISDGNKWIRKKIATKEIAGLEEWDSPAFSADSEVRTIALESFSFKLKDLSIQTQGRDWTVDLDKPMTRYNLNHVVIKLKSGKRIYGKLISAKGDSLVIKASARKPLIAIGYADIQSVGMHKKGSGGLGALIGGLSGGGLGLALLTTIIDIDDGKQLYELGGFLIAAPVLGAAIGSSNKQHLIQGDQKKFHLLEEQINKKLWTIKTSKDPDKK